MKAYNLADKKEYYAQPADEYTKLIMDCAEYYIDHGSHILLLIPDKNVDRGCAYRYFEINGNMYFAIVTQSHDNLIKIFNSQKYKQERLF